ncbi:ROK family protein, partial [Acinetobacter baumannii]|nr:ROK family protein [Acinetobacter baumannii]
LCLTYGTGVGGAIVIDKKIYTGSCFSAGEFGAVLVHPEDRNFEEDEFSGCYERYASTTALVKRVQKVFPELDNGRAIFARIN